MTKMSIARGTALSALGYGAFEILGGITEAAGGTGDGDEEQVQSFSFVEFTFTIQSKKPSNMIIKLLLTFKSQKNWDG